MRIIGNDPNTPRQTQVVASGTLSTGDTVVVNSDGTVSAITESGPSAGTPAVFETGTTYDTAAAYDASAQRVVVVYRDNGNSDYGTAVVGTVSGTSISFGTPVVILSSNSQEFTISYDAGNEKVVVTLRDEGATNAGRAYVGTVSGTSISFGSQQNYESPASQPSNVYVADEGKTAVIFKDGSQRGAALVGTVGSVISFPQAPAIFHSAQTNDPTGVSVGSSKIVIAYVDAADLDQGKALVATVSGNTISYGSHVTFNTGSSSAISAAYDSTNDRVVIAYRDNGNSGYGTAVVGTVSGTSISFGSEVVFNAASTFWTTATFDTANNKIVVACRDSGNDDGVAYVGTVSGTSISFDSGTIYDTDSAYTNSAVFDSNTNQTIIAYRDGGNSNRGTAVTFKAVDKNLTAENYIGTAKSGAADGDSVVVNTQGTVDTGQTGLTAGQSYYVQTDGTLSTTAGDPSVFAGTAVSSTKLIVKG